MSAGQEIGRIPSPGAPDPRVEQILRMLKIVHAAMIAAAVIYIFIGEQAARARELPGPIFFALIVVAAGCAGAALYVRTSQIEPAAENLHHQAVEPAVLGRWMTAHIMAFALLEAVALFGLVLRLLGARFSQVIGFYAAAILLLLAFAPRRPQ